MRCFNKQEENMNAILIRNYYKDKNWKR